MEKKCSVCKEIKPLDQFYKNASKKSGYAYECKQCKNAANRRWIKKNQAKHNSRRSQRLAESEEAAAINRRYQLAIKFNFTPEQFDIMLEDQGGVCKICKGTDPGSRWNRLCVDHNHNCCPTGRSCGSCIRGLLCNRCNRVLGFVNDDVELLRAMIEYLS